MALTIDKEIEYKDGSQYIVKIKEDILWDEAFGDQIGISKDEKALWFDEMLDLDDKEVREFIYSFFDDSIDIAFYIKEKIS